MAQPFVGIYSRPEAAKMWLSWASQRRPLFALVLGFTETALIPGISAAGATPQDRRFTALADAEFLLRGPHPQPRYPLPPLQAGASPALISRAVLTELDIPIQLFDAGLPIPPPVPHIALGGSPAKCVQTGQALSLATVRHLWQQGFSWGRRLAQQAQGRYLIVGECVVAGTTTALALLRGLGIPADGQVNSSHPTCNHYQKQQIVDQGLSRAKALLAFKTDPQDPLAVVAAIGDPMQPVVAAMALAASQSMGVMLAGGTQMLAVYRLMNCTAAYYDIPWEPDAVVIGTTRWVAEDSTGNTPQLAQQVQATLLATPLSFANSRYEQLRVYEQGFVKEGVGAGGCALAAHLYAGWNESQLLKAIEQTFLAQAHLSCQSHPSA